MNSNFVKVFREYPRFFVLKMIRLYQKTISFDHGILRAYFPHGYCRFHPSCSEYGYQAIEKYGLFRGGVKALWRIMRCNPWSRGGIDPVEKKDTRSKIQDTNNTAI
jgi:hypothetical protein